MKLRINGSWVQFVAPMRDRVPFTTHGSLFGKPCVPGDGLAYTARLPREYDPSLRTADYVVVSYSTAVAWHVPGQGWVVPDERYSCTTSKQMSRIRPAVAALQSVAGVA